MITLIPRVVRSIDRPALCRFCLDRSTRRHFSASAVQNVFRPQVPYDLPKPQIDAYGKPVRDGPDKVDELSEDDPAWRKRIANSEKESTIERLLQNMAEPPNKGNYERYGAHDGYGLKNKARWRVNEDGKLEKWEAAGENWKQRLGFKRGIGYGGVGRRVAVPGFQHRKLLKAAAESEAKREPYQQLPGTAFGVRPEALEPPSEAVDRDQLRLIDNPDSSDHQSTSTSSADHAAKGRRDRTPPHLPLAPSSFTSTRQFSTILSLSRRQHSTALPPRTLRKPVKTPNSPSPQASGSTQDKRHWQPTKKLTYSAMAGVRALHQTDPEKYNRKYLAKHFGISFEAVSRIIKSKWREKATKSVPREPAPAIDSGMLVVEPKSIQGTKWDRAPETSPQYSPIHAIARARQGGS